MLLIHIESLITKTCKDHNFLTNKIKQKNKFNINQKRFYYFKCNLFNNNNNIKDNFNKEEDHIIGCIYIYLSVVPDKENIVHLKYHGDSEINKKNFDYFICKLKIFVK
jgi:hypothetical protein